MKLRIEKAIYGGAGLARVPADAGPPLAGKTVFVEAALPGELVEATIAEDKRSFATGRLETILEPSPQRVVPGCIYVPRCGGCQYQHAHADAQLQMKLDVLEETLARAHVAVAGDIDAIAGPPWAYRNRIRLHVVKGSPLSLAYREGGSHKLLPVDHCPIAAPLLEQAIRAVEGIGLENLGEEVEFFTNGEQNQLLVSLWPGSARRPASHQSLERFAERLRSELPVLTGVGVFAERAVSYWGLRSLTYRVGANAYQASMGGFFQVNRFLLPDLLKLVLHDRSGRARTGRTAWDLYSGAGLFARALEFQHVTAVESAGVSADDLQQNLGDRAHRIVRSSTLAFLRSNTRGMKPDLVVVDPPRAGLGKDICTLLGQVAAPGMVYVSCDPATLARDLQSLLQNGYGVESMHLVDLFPQTFHMETVTCLKRN